MSVETVKEYLKAWGKDGAVREFAESCATVELAAKAVGVAPQRIAKTLSFRAKDSCSRADGPGCILVVAAGDARIDGRKFKESFGVKSKMLSPEEALACTGHAVGGICPFAVEDPLAAIYLDVSLRRFASVFTACGSSNSIMEITNEELFVISRARNWVDVCRVLP
jgi:prolyl-tRNA editing enzyme YbaK/EbsC (Cys-tRNA(Pro) deacylase)